MDKQNVLIISDSIVTNTGVANQSAEVAKALFNKGYGVFQIGVSQMEPNKKFLHTFSTGEQVTVLTDTAFDNVPLLLNVIDGFKIRAVILVTDPNRFTGIWTNARTIKNLVPIIYWNLWDTNLLPAPKSKRPHYNEWIYESCSSLPCISQQSENFVRQIISALPVERQPRVSYIPHGSNEFVFKPLAKYKVDSLRKQFFMGKDYDYVVLFNGRNQGRKKPADLIYAWNLFTQELTPEQAAKTALVLHTEPFGHPTAVGSTDLNAVIHALAPDTNIYIDHIKRTQDELNTLYNLCDMTINVSNAEGFGVPVNESLLAGTPIAATVTGGLQDSIGFFDDGGNRIKFSKDFSSNNVGKYRNHGIWSYPIWPQVQEIIGSTVTPYLFNDCVTHEGIKDALCFWYELPRDERKRRGLKGREWCINEGMTATGLAESFPKEVGETIASFKKQELFELFKA